MNNYTKTKIFTMIFSILCLAACDGASNTDGDMSGLDGSNEPSADTMFGDFEDTNLRKCFERHVDAHGWKNNNDVTFLTCKGVVNTSGIEKLTALERLDLQDSDISIIDLSGNIALTDLTLLRSSFSTIKLQENTALQRVHLESYSPIKALDFSNNTQLTELTVFDFSLFGSTISVMDFTDNTALTHLHLVNIPQLQSLELSNNRDLQLLHIEDTALAEIDLSNNSALEEFEAISNPLNIIKLPIGTSLTKLTVTDGDLESIDLSTSTGLTFLNLNENRLDKIDVSSISVLQTLILNDNRFTEIDLSENLLLKHLQMGDNELSMIDLSKNIALKYLFVRNNNLKTINLLHQLSFEAADLSGNQLTEMKVLSWYGQVFKLENNKLTSIEFLATNLIALMLYIEGNPINCTDIHFTKEFVDKSKSGTVCEFSGKLR